MAFWEGVGLNGDAPEGREAPRWVLRMGQAGQRWRGGICPVVLWSREGSVVAEWAPPHTLFA